MIYVAEILDRKFVKIGFSDGKPFTAMLACADLARKP